MTRRELVELLEDIPDDYLICISDESIRLLVAAGDAAVDEEARMMGTYVRPLQPPEGRPRLPPRGRSVIAALYVQADGIYADMPDVDPWPIERDARLYPGPWPVVAHPPCASWCQLAPVNLARWGSKIGDDGGTFAAALAAVRRWGGVLEHPAYSIAWRRYSLPTPTRNGWTSAFGDPGMTTEVDQAAYGHLARKRTWLYAVGVDPAALDWRRVVGAGVVGNGINSGECVGRERLSPRAANATPPTFATMLLDLARSVTL